MRKEEEREKGEEKEEGFFEEPSNVDFWEKQGRGGRGSYFGEFGGKRVGRQREGITKILDFLKGKGVFRGRDRKPLNKSLKSRF